MTAGSVAVLDAFTLGRWDAASPPTAVLLTLVSRSQKNTFFKILARRAAKGDQEIRVISCRDAFPKKHLQAAKNLAKRGNALRTGGSVASFRVVARGEGCVPVLEVKKWESDGRRESRWRVFLVSLFSRRGRRGGKSRRGSRTPQGSLRSSAARSLEAFQMPRTLCFCLKMKRRWTNIMLKSRQTAPLLFVACYHHNLSYPLDVCDQQ